MQLKDKKVQKAWTFYDWANSVYPLVISSAIFPIFYEGYVDSKVMFFGFEFSYFCFDKIFYIRYIVQVYSFAGWRSMGKDLGRNMNYLA